MKKVLFSFLAIGVLLASCNKKDAVGTAFPAAGLMAFNLAPDKDAVGFALSGNVLNNSPLQYTSYNGYYQNIYTGNREIQAFSFRDSVFASSTFNFADSLQYSLFLTGYNGKYQTITVKDDVDDNASADNAYIRYINAVPDSLSVPSVTITAGGTTVSDQPAAFNTVSPFSAVAGGDVTIKISNGGTISAERTIQLEKGKAYTALLVGVPGATDDFKKVQIRYIENGSLPASTNK